MLKKILARLSKHGLPHAVQAFLPIAISALVVGAVLYVHVPLKLQASTKPTLPAVKQIKRPSAPVQTSSPATTTPAVQPRKTTPAVPVTPAGPVAPVVVPSPSSSVSNLVPATAPATPATPVTPSSSGTSSSSSSSSSGGSSSSGSTANTNPPASTPPSYSSSNWSGYMMNDGGYTAVSGAWTVPSVSGNGSTTMADAAWIGIGGVTSNDLIQIGTEDTVTANGQVSSAGFYEILPAASVTIPNFSVTAGDQVRAAISQVSTGVWSLNITDITNGQTFATTLSYTSSLSSAEWIEEDPSYGNGRLVPFDTFASVPFRNSSATTAAGTFNLMTGNAASITLVSQRSGTPLAVPSAIGSDGASFSVTRQTGP